MTCLSLVNPCGWQSNLLAGASAEAKSPQNAPALRFQSEDVPPHRGSMLLATPEQATSTILDYRFAGFNLNVALQQGPGSMIGGIH